MVGFMSVSIWKYLRKSNWIISPNRDEHKKSLKLPPSSSMVLQRCVFPNESNLRTDGFFEEPNKPLSILTIGCGCWLAKTHHYNQRRFFKHRKKKKTILFSDKWWQKLNDNNLQLDDNHPFESMKKQDMAKQHRFGWWDLKLQFL